jgi:hypothetical protein
MTGMRRARVFGAAALLVTLAGASIATARIDHEPGRPVGVGLEYSHVGRARVRAAYLEAIGTGHSIRAARGEVRCARGAPDERAWSRPARPSRVAGRFACRSENGRAAMWWTDTDRGVLAHAVAPDADLARLFAWWLSHSER